MKGKDFGKAYCSIFKFSQNLKEIDQDFTVNVLLLVCFQVFEYPRTQSLSFDTAHPVVMCSVTGGAHMKLIQNQSCNKFMIVFATPSNVSFFSFCYI